MTDHRYYAKLCKLTFLQEEEVKRFWSLEFRGTSWARERPQITTVKGGHGLRIHIFRLSGETVVLFCPVDGMKNWPETIGDCELVAVATTRVHRGGYHMLEDHLDRLHKLIPATKVTYVGLSFGGTLAQIYCSLHPAPTVTFGSMRVGKGLSLQKWVTNYVNAGDPVPCIPPSFDQLVNQVDAKDCSHHWVEKGDHKSVWCHGCYLGVSFVLVDVYVHLEQMVWKMMPCKPAKDFKMISVV